MNAAQLTTTEFVDALAAGQPTPGGGGAAALTGSQAAALVSMVINFTVGKKKYAAVEAEMQRYRARSEPGLLYRSDGYKRQLGIHGEPVRVAAL